MALLCSNVSIRRSARLLKVNQKTIARKLVYLSKRSAIENKKFRLKKNNDQVLHLQFDDLITIEHTKLKPLSVTLAVDGNSRSILGFRVSEIPAFGHLSELSKRKYGKRKNNHALGLNELFKEIRPCIDPEAIIKSDEHQSYAPFVRNYFPRATHIQYKEWRRQTKGNSILFRKIGEKCNCKYLRLEKATSG